MRAPGFGGVNEGLTLWTAGRCGLRSARSRLTHAAEITHARRVAEIIPLIVHSSSRVSPDRTRAVRLKIQGFILKSSFDVAEHPSELHPGFRAVGAQSGQQGTLVILLGKESSLSHGSQKKYEACLRDLCAGIPETHFHWERETGAVIGAVQRGVVLKSSTHWISKDTSSLEIKVNRLFYKQSDQRESILSPVSGSDSLENLIH